MRFCRYPSPLGNLLIAEEGDAVVYCQWEDSVDERIIATWEEDEEQQNALLTVACRQLTEYFAGKRKAFDLPIRLNGTPFQQIVWKGLRQIPYGETLSYADLAHQIGRHKAARAVGNANHHNPLMIIIPCHRIVASNGKMGGYAGGIARKAWLLEKEKGNE
ncbi:methylated-DNA--[protein]-cysteine S-methyltransferase [Prevotella fusca]